MRNLLEEVLVVEEDKVIEITGFVRTLKISTEQSPEVSYKFIIIGRLGKARLTHTE